MKTKNDAALTLQSYLLPEPQHQQLTQLRDQLMLMTDFVQAATQQEDDELLQIRRSMLSKLFESFGSQIDHVLMTLQRSEHH
jgi:hypothetical protein